METSRRFGYGGKLWLLFVLTLAIESYVAGTSQVIRVATVQMEPFVRVRYEPGLIANDRYEGLYIDLLKQLAAERHLDFQLRLVPDGRIGDKGEDGTWNGLIGELERQTADIALAPILNTHARSLLVGFAPPLSPCRLSVLYHQSQTDPAPFGIVLNSETHAALREHAQFLEEFTDVHQVVYISSLMEGLFRVRQRAVKLLVISQLANHYTNQEPCDLVAEEFHTFPDLSFSIAGIQNSEILRDFSKTILQLNANSDLMSVLWNNRRRLQQTSCGPQPLVPVSIEQALPTPVPIGRQVSPRRLVISSVLAEPYLMRSPKQEMQYEGYVADLIQQMSLVVPFEYEWKIKRRFGHQRRKDGSWTGIMGDILHQTSHVAVGPFDLDLNHEQFVSQSKPFLESMLSFIVLRPQSHGDLVSIHTVEGLLEQTGFDFGVVHNSGAAKRLKRSRLPLYKKLWKALKTRSRENRLKTLQDGLDHVRQGQYVLILESTDAMLLTSQEPCELVSLTQYLPLAEYAFITAQGNLLLDDLNTGLDRLQENGVLQSLFHKWWNSEQCVGVEALMPEGSEVQTTVATTHTERQTVPLITLRPDFDLDLDAMLGLHTSPPPVAAQPDLMEYEGASNAEDRNSFDIARIFLTSPVSAFTPLRNDAVVPDVNDITPADHPGPIEPATTKFFNGRVTPPFESHVPLNESEITLTRDNFTDSDMFTNDIHEHETLSPSPTVSSSTIPTPTTTTQTSTTTKRRRKKKPGRKRNRNKHKPTVTPTLSPTPTNNSTPRHSPAWNFDGVFYPGRPQQSLDPDVTNTGAGPYGPNRDLTYTVNTEQHVTPFTHSASMTTTTSGSTARPTASDAATSRAVLVVLVIHLLMFGGSPQHTDCVSEDCKR